MRACPYCHRDRAILPDYEKYIKPEQLKGNKRKEYEEWFNDWYRKHNDFISHVWEQEYIEDKMVREYNVKILEFRKFVVNEV